MSLFYQLRKSVERLQISIIYQAARTVFQPDRPAAKKSDPLSAHIVNLQTGAPAATPEVELDNKKEARAYYPESAN